MFNNIDLKKINKQKCMSRQGEKRKKQRSAVAVYGEATLRHLVFKGKSADALSVNDGDF